MVPADLTATFNTECRGYDIRQGYELLTRLSGYCENQLHPLSLTPFKPLRVAGFLQVGQSARFTAGAWMLWQPNGLFDPSNKPPTWYSRSLPKPNMSIRNR